MFLSTLYLCLRGSDLPFMVKALLIRIVSEGI